MAVRCKRASLLAYRSNSRPLPHASLYRSRQRSLMTRNPMGDRVLRKGFGILRSWNFSCWAMVSNILRSNWDLTATTSAFGSMVGATSSKTEYNSNTRHGEALVSGAAPPTFHLIGCRVRFGPPMSTRSTESAARDGTLLQTRFPANFPIFIDSSISSR